MKFNELRLSDKNLFERFFSFNDYQLSTYHFSNIFIWIRLFRIFYTILNGYLCIFLKDKESCFMNLPPLGRKPDSAVINNCFAIMNSFNHNKNISRIENIEERDLIFYQKHGYAYSTKPGDYLCRREDIASLKGNRFKSKRASHNYFVKNYDFEFKSYMGQDEADCLALYKHWAKQRKNKFSDSLYQIMLEDSFLCHKLALENFLQLGLIGYVVKIKGKIAGYTFGFPVNPRIFCILFEICNLAYQGISQFIFSQFCQQLPGYEYINIMDDSGLENLREVKQSYRPVRIVPNYIIKRN